MFSYILAARFNGEWGEVLACAPSLDRALVLAESYTGARRRPTRVYCGGMEDDHVIAEFTWHTHGVSARYPLGNPHD